MKRVSIVLMLMFGAGQAVSAQTQGGVPLTEEKRRAVELEEQASIVAGGRGGRTRAGVESRVTRGAPYYAEAITEFTQQLADGNRISRTSVTRTFRDSDGRTRREATNDAGETVGITITDPIAGANYVLDPRTHTARRATMMVARAVPSAAMGGRGEGGGAASPATGVFAPATTEERMRVEAERQARVEQSATSRTASGNARAILERAASGGGETTTESLGTRMIEGVMAEGTRRTTVIPAGSLGNSQPITIVAEQWFSPDLQVFVLTRHSDPRTGETVYRLANLVRGEPDRTLFEVPADYTVK